MRFFRLLREEGEMFDRTRINILKMSSLVGLGLGIHIKGSYGVRAIQKFTNAQRFVVRVIRIRACLTTDGYESNMRVGNLHKM
jgi:hypothetical protein